jgi:hypothetical protein
MRKVTWLLAGLTVMVGVAFGMAGSNWLGRWDGGLARIPYVIWNEKPYLHSGDGVHKTVFHAGDPVFIHIVSQRTMPCYAEVSTRIISLRDVGPRETPAQHSTIWFDYPQTRFYSVAGVYERNFRIIIPPDMPSGAYYIERMVVSVCEHASKPEYQTEPLIPFTIEN